MPTEDQVIRERWVRGRLGYKLHDGQKDLKNAFLTKSLGQIFVNECGRQFGKTFFWVCVAIEFGIQNPGSKIKIGTAFQTDLLEFIIPAFDAVTEDCPEDLMPRYIGYRSKYVLHTGSEIKLVGLDKKPNGMRGNVIDLIIIDEAGFTDRLEYLYKSVIIPATTHRPTCRVVMSSSTPRQEDHAFFEFVEKAQFEGAYIVKTIHDNPMIDQKTIDRLSYEMGGTESDDWKREYLCVRLRDKTLTVVPEWKDEYIKETVRDQYYGFYHKYVSMDLGVRDHTCAIFAHYDFLKAKLICEDEYTISGSDMTTKVLKEGIEGKEKDLVWGNVYLRISDNNNPLLNQDLSVLHGINFLSTEKGTLEEMVNALRIMVGRGQIEIDSRCKQLIGCLRYGSWDKKKSQFSRSKVYGHYDALAALIYLVRNLNKTTNPIPVTFQVDFSNQLLLHRDRPTHNSTVLKNAFSKGLRR